MNYRELFVKLFTDAAQDKPSRPSVQIIEGCWTLTINGNRDQWGEMVQAACAPNHAEQVITGDTLVVRWASVADQIFGQTGMMAQRLDGYEMRAPQLYMARLIQRSIEMGEPAIIEAGTGTGKSFAYAAVAMAMDKKLVISTSNKALQAQLYQKDIPFLCEMFPGKKVALAQGKSNYLCQAKYADKGISHPDLAAWAAMTESGNVEELEFNVPDLNQWTVDDDCTGKRCPLYVTCFYYAAKRERQQADVIICNHALLILDRIYPQAQILPGCDVVVVDEAHKLAEYARGALGQEFTLGGVKRALSIAHDCDAHTADAELHLQEFGTELARIIGDARDRQVGLRTDHELSAGKKLGAELYDVADEVWPAGDSPEDDNDLRLARRADRIRTLADTVLAASSTTQPGHVRWIEVESQRLVNVPFDVSAFIGRMAGFETVTVEASSRTHCTRCNRALTADKVFVLDGLAYGPDCIRHVDLFGDAELLPLVEWLNTSATEAEERHDPTAIIFTSATIAAPNLAHFMRECGLSHGFQMVANSPFDYENNALLYIPNGDTPQPSSPAWAGYMVDELHRLVTASSGGAFLLFTSYRNMQTAVTELRHRFERAGLAVYVQGELPKGEIARRFRDDGDAVLFATKSFWEGISIEGAALRLVVIDKMPFQAPSPLLTARESVVKNPFIELHVPEMIIDLKQGSGRLIRRMDDYGVIALLDSRARLKPYGRSMVIPALPPARLVHSVAAVTDFFYTKSRAGGAPASDFDFPVMVNMGTGELAF